METQNTNNDKTYQLLNSYHVFESFQVFFFSPLVLQDFNNWFFFSVQPIFQTIVQCNLNKTRCFSP